jgi:TonB family protein
MDSKKVFFWPVIISIIGHVALITISSIVDLRDNVKAAELFMVQITQSQPESEPKPAVEPKQEQKPVLKKKPQQIHEAKPLQPPDREDTVDLGSSDVKYAAYLESVKKKIMPIWESFQANEIGIVVITMSVNENGSLSQLLLTSSSGSPSLDQGTLDVINASAPFKPLPTQYNLSRLNIIASFRYQ